MQSNKEKAKKTHLILMPISWAIAVVVVYDLMVVLSKISGSSMKVLFQTDLLRSLLVILPGLFFGKVLGLIFTHLITLMIPPLHRTFKAEVSEAGRYKFAQAVRDLIRLLVLTGIVTFIGSFLFLQFR